MELDLRKLLNELNHEEIDVLKYKLSILGVENLENVFQLSSTQSKREYFFKIAQLLVNISSRKERLNEYAIAYLGKPKFISSKIINQLIFEANKYKSLAIKNYNQHIYQVNTTNLDSFCETLYYSDAFLNFVKKYAGNCERTHVLSYVYYKNENDCSIPHIDNSFTPITVMLGLEHKFKNEKTSKSIIYWPNKEPFEYSLSQGEMSIFFGTSMIHGRTPISTDESLAVLLFSFKPCQ